MLNVGVTESYDVCFSERYQFFLLFHFLVDNRNQILKFVIHF